MSKHIVLSGPDFEQVAKDYSNYNLTIDEGCAILGVSFPTLRRNLANKGIEIHKRGRIANGTKEAFRLWLDLKTARKIYKKVGSYRRAAMEFGISHETLRQRLMDDPYSCVNSGGIKGEAKKDHKKENN